MKSIELLTIQKPLLGTIRPPGSKSLTNRALVCAALADGESVLAGALASDDTRVMVEGLGKLGVSVTVDDAKSEIVVSGCGGKIPSTSAELFVGNSGTTMRFLTAVAALGHGTYRLDGVPRMRERPIRDLLDALAQLGVRAESEHGNGCPPVAIHAMGLPGGKAKIRGDVSSQFLSGMLMAAPYAASPIEITIDGPLVSQPYVDMTLRVMADFGVTADAGKQGHFRIDAPRCYKSRRRYEIEPDASAASYFWAAAAITGGEIKVEGLTRQSCQGDVAFVDCLKQMGCEVQEDADGITIVGKALQGIDVDMNAISDTVQTLSVVALFAEGPTNIRGVPHIRHKETDRIAAVATELRKLGARIEERTDGLAIHPPVQPHGATIDTYDDHRMAMSFALAGLRVPGVIVNDPSCTKKTYPTYFSDLMDLGVSWQQVS